MVGVLRIRDLRLYVETQKQSASQTIMNPLEATTRQRHRSSVPVANAQAGIANSQVVLSRPERNVSRLFQIIVLLFVSISSWLFARSSSLLQFETIQPWDYAARTKRVLSHTPLIDGHNDLPFLLRLQLNNQIYQNNLPFSYKLASHTDLVRMRAGQVGGQFWSVFVQCPNVVHLDDPTHSVRDTLEQIDVAKRLIAEYPDLKYCETSSCAQKSFKSGRIASMLGAEGLHQTGNSIGVVRQLYDLGARYITLTHNCDNAFATAASTVTKTGQDHGLSVIGRHAVTEMNRLGMMVDLSHTSHRTMRDVLAITRSPVIFSHSGCYSLVPKFRNTPDDVLRQLPQNGGLIMIFFARNFLRADDPGNASLEDVVDHIFHAAAMAGWDHVGIGSDFDGTDSIANGINDVGGYPRLIEAVMRRGATDEQVEKLVGKNLLRVWRQNELVARQIQKSSLSKPSEEVWEGRTPELWDGSLPSLKDKSHLGDAMSP